MYTVIEDAAESRREFQQAFLILMRIQVALLALMLWTVNVHPLPDWLLAP
jgi:hypothetical protein